MKEDIFLRVFSRDFFENGSQNEVSAIIIESLYGSEVSAVDCDRMTDPVFSISDTVVFHLYDFVKLDGFRRSFDSLTLSSFTPAVSFDVGVGL